MVTDAATRVSVALDICQKETYRLLGCADVGQLTVYLDSNTAGEGTAAILLTYRDVGRRDGVAWNSVDVLWRNKLTGGTEVSVW